RVVNLVGPRAENAGLVDTPQNVGKPQPIAVEQHALSNCGLTLAHGFEAAFGGFGAWKAIEIDNLLASTLDRFDVLLLVRQPSLREHFHEGVRVLRLLPKALRHLHVQRGAMPAGEEAAEV